jgi:UDPglucose 6-dehydrogenase
MERSSLVPYRLTVIGTGYLGITHAACMADLGYEVLGLDIDADKVRSLNNGQLPIHEPGLEPVLRRGLESGKLRFTTSYEEAGQFGDVHFICVGTPQKKGEYAADVSYMDAAIDSLAPHLDRECRWARRPGWPTGWRCWRPRARRRSWRGTRSSCARASPCTTR